MSESFVVFDVETPNASNSRMSAIGLTVVEDGRIVDELFTLVNPETYFHPFNIALTGITPEMAERAPTFDQLWETIGPMMSSGLLVAHNAPFDMSVLAKCLRPDPPRRPGPGGGYGPAPAYIRSAGHPHSVPEQAGPPLIFPNPQRTGLATGGES